MNLTKTTMNSGELKHVSKRYTQDLEVSSSMGSVLEHLIHAAARQLKPTGTFISGYVPAFGLHCGPQSHPTGIYRMRSYAQATILARIALNWSNAYCSAGLSLSTHPFHQSTTVAERSCCISPKLSAKPCFERVVVLDLYRWVFQDNVVFRPTARPWSH